MQNFDDNIILKKCVEFSLKTIEYVELLESNKKFIIANQLLKSATSIGANIYEAQNAESKTDCLHKIQIAAKEKEETKYWLLLCSNAKSYPDCELLIQQLVEIEKILSKIISTTQKNKLPNS
jgi:four helix bundle protein